MNELSFYQQALYRIVHLEPAEWADISAKMVIKRFAKGDFLLRQGQVENYIYFLNKGATRSYFLRDGKEFTVDFLFRGDFSTAYYSLITREPSTMFIELLEDAEVVMLSFQHLQEFYAKYKNGEKIGRLMAEHQYVKRLRKEMDLLSRTAEERYLQLLERSPELVQNISVKHLSTYLGIQPESLSRIRKAHARN
ncbi:MAG: Crp/Fnr family transcriptional regulator [Filimonas sp.]|nr:Crp/Fnr family transcriptional regulator [Filimonas sp.]